jgi:hypothetical protein
MGIRKSKEQTLAEVYLRLASYEGEPSKKERTIAAWLEKDKHPRAKVLTPKLTRKNGWLFTDAIERYDPPYTFPEKHRYDYLNNPLIESKKYAYVVRKRSTEHDKTESKNRQEYTETAYRLKRNKTTANKVFKFIQEHGDIFSYTKTPYNQAFGTWAQIRKENELFQAQGEAREIYLQLGEIIKGERKYTEEEQKELLRAARAITRLLRERNVTSKGKASGENPGESAHSSENHPYTALNCGVGSYSDITAEVKEE